MDDEDDRTIVMRPDDAVKTVRGAGERIGAPATAPPAQRQRAQPAAPALPAPQPQARGVMVVIMVVVLGAVAVAGWLLLAR